jgi:hypothetical protein
LIRVFISSILLKMPDYVKSGHKGAEAMNRLRSQ